MPFSLPKPPSRTPGQTTGCAISRPPAKPPRVTPGETAGPIKNTVRMNKKIRTGQKSGPSLSLRDCQPEGATA